MLRITLVTAATLATAAPAAAEDPYEVVWVRQLGTARLERSQAIAVDSVGNAYLSGYTEGSLGGPIAGVVDAFLVKLAPTGAVLWTQQLGTSETDYGFGVAVDETDNVYIGGYTKGSLGGPSAGNWDAFVAKYNPLGALLWTRQLGTVASDTCHAVAADGAGNVYISGYTALGLGGPPAGARDAFLAKYDSSGEFLWARQLGTPLEDYGYAIAADQSGNAYLTGSTDGEIGGPSTGGRDAFLAKYDADGNLLWVRQLGTTGYEDSRAVAVDSAGNAYVGGTTDGSLGGTGAGSADAYLAKFDPFGAIVWIRQLGTTHLDSCLAVAVDQADNAYISGWTDGSLGGPSAGERDTFLAKYDAAGALLWTRQLGTPFRDIGEAVAVDSYGNAYVGGDTFGSFGGPSAISTDLFVAKYSSCGIDCDGDGELTFFDFLCFQNAFSAGDPAADCDGDGELTFFDFLCFQNAFAAGCP